MKKFYSLPEVPALLGVPYYRVYYALLLGVVNPLRAGRARLFTEDDVNVLREHFQHKDEPAAK